MDAPLPPDFFLVIPAFREAGRLPPYLDALQRQLAEAPYVTHILVVDDGSPAEDQQALVAKIPPRVAGRCTVSAPLLLKRNYRKGGAILRGWRQASGRWLGFVDADGAIPAAEVRRLFDEIYGVKAPPAAFFASRVRMLGRKVERHYLRHLAGRCFALLVSVVTGEQVYDSQCGFKVVAADAFRQIDGWLEGRGFCFDVELLVGLRLAGGEVREVPIDWREEPGGTVRLRRHALRMVLDLWAIRRRARQARPSPRACPPPSRNAAQPEATPVLG